MKALSGHLVSFVTCHTTYIVTQSALGLGTLVVFTVIVQIYNG